MITNYIVVTSWNNDLPNFKNEIIRLCGEGWELQGGVSISGYEDGSYRLAQALVKKTV